MLKAHNLEPTLPNVELALPMYLSLMVKNCSDECSFSKRKRIKNEQRTSLGHERLNHLSLLSIEYKLLQQIDTQDIDSKF